MEKNAIKIFDDKTVRTVWDAEQEKWFFSIIDIIAILPLTILSLKRGKSDGD